MSDLPISDAAVEAACIAEHGDSLQFPWVHETTAHIKKRRVEVRAGIEAFLAAEGIRLQQVGEQRAGETVEPSSVRLVGPWREP